jgi:hypothetical protein
MEKNQNDLIVIKTARNKESINEAALNGYRLIIKKVEPSSQIRSKYSVVQHIETGEIEVIGDLRVRLDYDHDPNFETIIDWTLYYPYNFESPFAAYLIPPDLEKGERVMVEDIIEDIVAGIWNQGDAYRLESCEAIWNGEDLIIQNEPERGPWIMKG